METVGELRDILTSIDSNVLVDEEAKLQLNDGLLIASLLNHLADVDSSTALNAQYVQAALALFETRWQRVMGTSLDYTLNQENSNQLWIHFAEQLALSKHVNLNCYRILMRSIQNDTCSVFATAITEYPLSSLLLSQDKSALVPLDVVRKNFEHTRKLTYIRDGQQVNLSPEELAALKKNKAYLRWYENVVRPVIHNNQRISYHVYLWLKAMVERSCFKRGEAESYNDNENQQAEAVFLDFANFLATLPKEEREALFNQYIDVSDYYASTFKEIWFATVGKEQLDDDRRCITYLAKFYCKLLLDYDPEVQFGGVSDPSQRHFLNQWTQSTGVSEKKSVTLLGEGICRQRLQQLCAYILVTPFKVVFGTGTVLALPHQPLTVPNTVHVFYQAAVKGLRNGHCQQSYYEILTMAIDEKFKASSRHTRYGETQDWFNAIADGTFWQQDSLATIHTDALLREMALVKQRSTLMFGSESYTLSQINLKRLKRRYADCDASLDKIISDERQYIASGNGICSIERLNTIVQVLAKHGVLATGSDEVTDCLFFGSQQSDVERVLVSA